MVACLLSAVSPNLRSDAHCREIAAASPPPNNKKESGKSWKSTPAASRIIVITSACSPVNPLSLSLIPSDLSCQI